MYLGGYMEESSRSTISGSTNPLLGAIRHASLGYLQELLTEGKHDPNEIHEKTGLNGLQLAIEYGGEQTENIINLLVNNERKKIDINLTGKNFVLPLDMVVKSNNLEIAVKIRIISLLIAKRKIFNQDLFYHYLHICVERTSHHFTHDDFALMAHYVSRLCGCDVGNILNREHNSDRYMVHLCQYSYAKKEGDELEGWHADEFLPLRIFSLFEILVKIKKGITRIPEDKKEKWIELICSEIISEVETLRREQERQAVLAISKIAGVSEQDVKMLYFTLAKSFVSGVRGCIEERMLVGGYKGHTFYCAFLYEATRDSLIIRYDNLGSGKRKSDPNNPDVKIPRHPRNGDGKWMSRLVRLINVSAKQDDLIKYIKFLLMVKSVELPPRENSDAREQEKQNILAKIYDDDNTFGCVEVSSMDRNDLIKYIKSLLMVIKSVESPPRENNDAREQEKQNILAKIYDDNNTLGWVEVSSMDHIAMDEQEADTCVATSHQVGLLHRCGSKRFYEWLVAEEKRCILQAERNEGALSGTKEERFWTYDDMTFRFPKYFFYCMHKPFYIFLKGIETFITRENRLQDKSLNSPLTFFRNCFEAVHTKNVINLKKNLEELLRKPENSLASLDILIVYVRCALSFFQEPDVNFYLFVDQTIKELKKISESEKYKCLPEIEYCLALLCFRLCLNKECEQHLRNYKEKLKSVSPLLLLQLSPPLETAGEFISNIGPYRSNEPLRIYYFDGTGYVGDYASKIQEIIRLGRISSKLCLGYLALEKNEINSAIKYFQNSGEKSANYGLACDAESEKVYYSPPALLGLGICYFEKAKAQVSDQKVESLKLAMVYLAKIGDDSNVEHALGMGAKKYLDKIAKLFSNQELQSENTMAKESDSKRLKSNQPKLK